jgi:hypothetical protein
VKYHCNRDKKHIFFEKDRCTKTPLYVQGWKSERVVHEEGPHGRILLVLPTDPAVHQRKVDHLLPWPMWLPFRLRSNAFIDLAFLLQMASKACKGLTLPSEAQVKELSMYLEEQLGLVKGWLALVPCKVNGSPFFRPILASCPEQLAWAWPPTSCAWLSVPGVSVCDGKQALGGLLDGASH